MDNQATSAIQGNPIIEKINTKRNRKKEIRGKRGNTDKNGKLEEVIINHLKKIYGDIVTIAS